MRVTYAVIYWVPFGIPGAYGAAQLPIGVMCGAEAGEGAVGLVPLPDLLPVAAVLGGTQPISELDEVLMQLIAVERMPPAEAHARFPGLQRHGYQTWQVAEPQPLRMARRPAEHVRSLWTRLGALPLRIASWAPTEVAEPVNAPEKGQKGGRCNSEKCRNLAEHWVDPLTQAYYCQRCAWNINSYRLYVGERVVCKRDDPASAPAQAKQGV